jgi:hypothetical protein
MLASFQRKKIMAKMCCFFVGEIRGSEKTARFAHVPQVAFLEPKTSRTGYFA